jgi:hypothetical protein
MSKSNSTLIKYKIFIFFQSYLQAIMLMHSLLIAQAHSTERMTAMHIY